jgi:hypothetical protein
MPSKIRGSQKNRSRYPRASLDEAITWAISKRRVVILSHEARVIQLTRIHCKPNSLVELRHDRCKLARVVKGDIFPQAKALSKNPV